VKDTEEYADNIFKRLDDLTIDTLLLHIAHARESQDENGFSWLMSATILDDRGLEPTKRKESGKIYETGHRTEDIDKIYHRVQQLEAFWIKIKKVSTINGKTLRNPAILEGRLLTVSQKLRHENSERVYGWKYRLLDGLKDLANDKKFLLVSRKVIEYDPKLRSPEKRIGLYAAIHFRLNSNKSINRRIKTIYEYCHLPHEEANPARSIKRIHEALIRLSDDNVIGDWWYIFDEKFTKALPLMSWKDYQTLMLRLEPPSDLPSIKTRRQKSLT
jgi:hypothetical protein